MLVKGAFLFVISVIDRGITLDDVQFDLAFLVVVLSCSYPGVDRFGQTLTVRGSQSQKVCIYSTPGFFHRNIINCILVLNADIRFCSLYITKYSYVKLCTLTLVLQWGEGGSVNV